MSRICHCGDEVSIGLKRLSSTGISKSEDESKRYYFHEKADQDESNQITHTPDKQESCKLSFSFIYNSSFAFTIFYQMDESVIFGHVFCDTLLVWTIRGSVAAQKEELVT